MFTKLDPAAASAAGRKGMAARWDKATQDEKDATAARMRVALRAKYRDEACTAFASLGVDPTPEQLELATTLRHQSAQRAAAALGREVLRRTLFARAFEVELQRQFRRAAS